MKQVPFQDLITFAFLTIGLLYGVRLFIEEIFSILPLGIVLVFIVAFIGYLLRIPKPSSEAVEKIIGRDLDALNGDNEYVMKTVAHRGAGFDYPENSLTAFNMCAEKGCDAIEFDITLTKDNIPIVFHDDTLERMTDLKMKISEHTYAEMCNVDISVKHAYKERFYNTNIPTLEQTVIQLLGSGQRMFIDIKDNSLKMVKVIHDLFQLHPELYSKAIVSSFYPIIIYLVRKGDPKIVCSMAYRPNFFAYESYNYPVGKGSRKFSLWLDHYFCVLCDKIHDWLFKRVTYHLVGISVLLLHKDLISGKEVLYWRERGIRVMAWTANTPAEKQYLAKVLKITYLTDTLTGEGTTHSN